VNPDGAVQVMARKADPKRRDDIMRAARAVFSTRGYSDARMSDIAAQAGVAAGTVYLYFESKEALVEALCDDYLNRLAEALAPAMAERDPAKAIERSVRVALEFAGRERDLMRLLDLRTALGKRDQALPADLRLHELIAQSMQARIDSGEMIPYEPLVLAELVGGLIEWVAKVCLVWGSGDTARYEATVTRLLQNALLPPPPINR